MNDIFLFVFGFIVTALAIGPLIYAAIAEQREK